MSEQLNEIKRLRAAVREVQNERDLLLTALKHAYSVINKGYQIEKGGGFHQAMGQAIKEVEDN